MIEKDGWMMTWSYKKQDYVRFCTTEEWQARNDLVKAVDSAPDDQKQAVLEKGQKEIRKMHNKNKRLL